MKRPYIKILGVVVILFAGGLIFTSLRASKKFNFDKKAAELHKELIASNHMLTPEKAAEILSSNDANYIFIDIRNPRDYDNFHIKGAINLPLPQILDDEYKSYLKSSKTKILYSDESIEADQIRLLLTQYGYDNLLVLQGGAAYWKDNMLSDDLFTSKSEYDDEKLKFDPSKL